MAEARITTHVGIGLLRLAAFGFTTQYFLNMEIERYTLATGEQAAGFDPHSLDFDAALSFLVDVGLLSGTGVDGYRITVAGISEVTRRPRL